MSAPHSPGRTAAFVRVEELLLAPHEVLGTLYAAANSPGVGGRLGRLGALAASLPALGVLHWADRRKARRLACLHYRGLGADRIEVLAAEFYERFLEGRVRPTGEALIARQRADGHMIVLVSAGLEAALRPLAERVGADLLLGSALEMRDGVATGRLIEPFADERLAACARKHGINLAGSYGYGVDGLDLPLLLRVGFPCAVNPDRGLRRIAEEERWPLLEVRS